MHTPHVLSGGRYPVLRALAIIYVIGAGLALVSTLIGVGYALFGTGSRCVPLRRVASRVAARNRRFQPNRRRRQLKTVSCRRPGAQTDSPPRGHFS